MTFCLKSFRLWRIKSITKILTHIYIFLSNCMFDIFKSSYLSKWPTSIVVWSNYGKVLGLYFSIRIVCMNLTSFSIKKGRKKKKSSYLSYDPNSSLYSFHHPSIFQLPSVVWSPSTLFFNWFVYLLYGTRRIYLFVCMHFFLCH